MERVRELKWGRGVKGWFTSGRRDVGGEQENTGEGSIDVLAFLL